jgi:hypothetical protein
LATITTIAADGSAVCAVRGRIATSAASATAQTITTITAEATTG